MSIKDQVDDAIILEQAGRYTGALTMLLLAVAASSRKVFPKAPAGMKRAESERRGFLPDSEAFKRFLAGRMRKISGDDYGSPDIGINESPFHREVAHNLYEYYRNALIHEGNLHQDVEFRTLENS